MFFSLFVGTVMGLCAMILYYRFFHPAGPINPCVGESVDLKYDIDSPNIISTNSNNMNNDNVSNFDFDHGLGNFCVCAV